MADAKDSLTLEARQRIDARCDQFEAAWKAGQRPAMEDMLEGFDSDARRYLLVELLMVELQYRRGDRGQALTDMQLLESHPRLRNELAERLADVRQTAASLPSSIGATSADLHRPPPELPRGDAMETTVYTGRRLAAGGLHMRCPHCSNPVELLADMPANNITCRSCGSAFNLVEDDEPADAPTKQKLDRFELVSPLGMGAFGTVWQARDEELDRFVAIKVPRKGRLPRGEAEMFFREARTAAQLRHPNIVPIHEIGRDYANGTIFIVSELIHGQSLMDWMEERRPNTREIAELISTIADALHYAHQCGVIHRDLKPANIMIDAQGQPSVMDFGLAKREVGEITMTVDGHILGTPAYMSPEQARGEAHWTDRRTDIYALGVMLFELATGELPFRGNAQMQVQERLTSDAPDPRTLNPHINRDFSTICLKCLERDPNGRYDTAGEVAEELRRFLRGEPVRARPISRIERVLRWSKRNPLAASTIVLGTILAIGGPITAVVLARLNQSLETRFQERTELIQRYESENEQLADENARLVEEQRAFRRNRPAVVPGAADQQKELIKSYLEKHYDTLAANLPDANSNPVDCLRAHLGLAMLAEEADELKMAIVHYEAAHDLLARLIDQGGSMLSYRVTLADCAAKLGELHYEDADAKLASQWTEQALALRQKLAADYPDRAEFHVEQLTSFTDLYDVQKELNRDVPEAERSADNSAKLLQSQSMQQSLEQNWPTDPTKIYDFARYLTQGAPSLEPADDNSR